MLDNTNLNEETDDVSGAENPVQKNRSIRLPANWWSSQNSIDHLINKSKPALHLLKPEQKSSVTDYDLPSVKGWDVKSGDYRVKIDEPERDFKKEKINFKYKIFTAAIVLTIFTIWFVSMLVSKFAVMK
jgi:predicted phosphohydrolase